MVVKFGKYGKFIACSGFPDCRNIVKLINTLKDIDCPKCGGSIVVRKTKKGRLFYGCSNYPNCNFVSWYEPTNEKCPQCGEILFRKKGKKPVLFCNAEGCGYAAEDTLEETEIIQTIVSQTADTEENE